MAELITKQVDIANVVIIASSSLSFLGSVLILTTLFRTPKAKRWSTPYHRLLFTISIYDLLFSASLVTGRAPMPSETNIPGAVGTFGTCSAQVFFRQAGFASFPYSAALIGYYVLLVRYRVRDEWIAKWYEPVVHVVCSGFFIITALVGVVLKVYNPGTYLLSDIRQAVHVETV